MLGGIDSFEEDDEGDGLEESPCAYLERRGEGPDHNEVRRRTNFY